MRELNRPRYCGKCGSELLIDRRPSNRRFDIHTGLQLDENQSFQMFDVVYCPQFKTSDDYWEDSNGHHKWTLTRDGWKEYSDKGN